MRTKLVLATVLTLLGACRTNDSSALPTVERYVTHWVGSTAVYTAEGARVGTIDSTLERAVLPSRSTIQEVRVQRSSHPDDRANELISTARVSGENFTIVERNGAFEGKGKLIGEPWDWTSWTSSSNLPDGSSVMARYQFEGGDLVGERRLLDAQGELSAILNDRFRPVDSATYSSERARLIAQ